jgi:hypothetical protein
MTDPRRITPAPGEPVVVTLDSARREHLSFRWVVVV